MLAQGDNKVSAYNNKAGGFWSHVPMVGTVASKFKHNMIVLGVTLFLELLFKSLTTVFFDPNRAHEIFFESH
jgi:hypothetical protein